MSLMPGAPPPSGTVRRYTQADTATLEHLYTFLRNVVERLVALEPVPWVRGALKGAWTNKSADYFEAAYRVTNYEVVLRGTVSGGSGLVFSLPKHLAPTRTLVFAATTDTGAGSVSVDKDGGVTLLTGGTSTVHLDGIRFARG